MRILPIIIMVAGITAAAVAQQQPRVTFVPEKPQVGKALTITYNAAHKQATLAGAKQLEAQVLALRGEDVPLLVELPMTAKGRSFSATLPGVRAEWQLLLVRIVAGEKTDDNAGDVWTLMPHAGAQPVRGARIALAQALRDGGMMEFARRKDAAAAATLLREELAAHPGDVRAQTMLWNIDLRKADSTARAGILAEVEKLHAQHQTSDSLVALMLPVFEGAGARDRAAAIRSAAIAAHPTGRVAHADMRSAINAERDAAKRITLIERFLAEFTLPVAYRHQLVNSIVRSRVQLRDYERAIAELDANDGRDAMLYNTLAQAMAADSSEPDRITDRLQVASDLARRGADMLRVPDNHAKPSYTPTREWQENQSYRLSIMLNTLATILEKGGRGEEATHVLREAHDASRGRNTEVTVHYFDALTAVGKPFEALEIARAAFRDGKGDAELETRFRRVLGEVTGSEGAADTELAALRDQARGTLRAKLAGERLSLPAPDFTLTALDGSTVTLSALKGKVVVVDFWATWCGPCKASFPTLQKFHEQYAADDRVKILTLNTWETEKGAKREEVVRKFIADNGYTFPVLFDTDLVDAYGVKGIPTKFVIGPDGRIAFKSVGFESGESMMNELALQFELLLPKR